MGSHPPLAKTFFPPHIAASGAIPLPFLRGEGAELRLFPHFPPYLKKKFSASITFICAPAPVFFPPPQEADSSLETFFFSPTAHMAGPSLELFSE